MIFVALNESAEKGELILVDGGMCRFHRRRDGILVIREVIVLPSARRQGIGSALVRTICKKHRGIVIAKCPKMYKANAFWKAIGFSLIQETNGINEWQLNLS